MLLRGNKGRLNMIFLTRNSNLLRRSRRLWVVEIRALVVRNQSGLENFCRVTWCRHLGRCRTIECSCPHPELSTRTIRLISAARTTPRLSVKSTTADIAKPARSGSVDQHQCAACVAALGCGDAEDASPQVRLRDSTGRVSQILVSAPSVAAPTVPP